jgi:hypothetical protein
MLRDVKVGDRVRSCLAGWGEIVAFDGKDIVKVNFNKCYNNFYFRDGKSNRNDLYPEIVEVQKKKKWKPEGGYYFIRGDGSIGMARKIPNDAPDYYKEEGRTYPTQKLAEKARKMIRPYQRLVAYVLEHAPNWQPDWKDDEKYKTSVVYDHDFERWEVCGTKFSEYCTLYMPKDVAEELCNKLNSGEVEL